MKSFCRLIHIIKKEKNGAELSRLVARADVYSRTVQKNDKKLEEVRCLISSPFPLPFIPRYNSILIYNGKSYRILKTTRFQFYPLTLLKALETGV